MSDNSWSRSCDRLCKLCGKTGTTHYLALIDNRCLDEGTEFDIRVCPECAAALAEAYAGEDYE